MKAVGTVFGERAVHSALIRASESWRGVKVTEFEHAQLLRLQKQELLSKVGDGAIRRRPLWPEFHLRISHSRRHLRDVYSPAADATVSRHFCPA